MFKKFSNPEILAEGNCGGSSSAPSSTPSVASTPSASPAPSQASPSPAPAPIATPSTSKPKVNSGGNYNEAVYGEKELMNKVYHEYMLISDYHTLGECMALNEAEQNSLLLSLTNKMYNMIVGKIDDIDFGDIPNTKGDIRKLPKYKQLKECVEVLRGIFTQYKEDVKPIDELDNAFSNIENNRDLFIASYAGGIEVGMVMYNTMTLALINSISFMIAVCIEYVKNPKSDGLMIMIDKTGIAKVKDHLVYENIIKFNDACTKGDIEKVLRPLIQNKVKNFAMTASGLWLGFKTVMVVGGFLVAIIPLLRDLVYFFFAARARMSSYLDIQADLLEMNANELDNNEDIHTEGDKKKVIARQLAIARMFHNAANKIAVEAKSSEVQATREIRNDTKKYRIDDVNTNPSNDSSDGPLF